MVHLLSSRTALASGLVVGLATLCISLPALAQKKPEAGVSDAEIVLGMPMPLSGPVSGYSVVGKVAEAYFKKLNEQGGIHGRKVRLLIYDDQYSPPKTVEVARRLVEEDQVLAIFGNLGTAPNMAIQRYMNAKKVPQLFVQSGASQFDDAAKYPWTVPFLGSYQGEGRVFARHIIDNRPDAKIAVLMQNDDLGREVLKGLQEGLSKQGKAKIVAQATFEVTDPTVDSQVVQLKSSGADVLVMAATARTAAQAIRKVADVGWTPDRYLNFAAASVKMAFEPAGADKAKGVVALAVYKEPMSPRWSRDPEVLEYLELLKTHASGVDPSNGSGVSGYIVAQLMAHVLREAGANPTRESVRVAASTLKSPRISMLLPGVAMANSAADLHAYASMQPVRFNGVDLDPVGPALNMK
ncbi:ABC transporter substrate-binding protein [Variovorax boronicumulans]|uniref:ABC transporter substrate-binding protein n=1 Tax=Variovorax boronicumulans TaxID=436515 RepID=UPI0012E40968|nr:ABC transporter substrate-binding protein [Variovorax boronicumulans]GER14470.1 branched-chain amino acid ABC transporter substrate-binding protein [Variovorax boronicumulans]